jgi:hypothetical protein
MPSNNWSERFARGFAILRGAMLVLSMVMLIVAPERAMPGSSTGLVRTVALMFASRTIVLGTVLVFLAIRQRRAALAWVLFADAVLQVFDTAMAITLHRGAVALLPAAIGAVDVWAGLTLLRSARRSPALP